MRRLLPLFAGLVFLLAGMHVATAEQPNVPGAVRATDIVAALEKAGAEIKTVKIDSAGDPMIEARGRGLNFSVRFYKCRGDACTQVQFRVSFHISSMSEADKAARMRKWNSDWVFGKAYVNDKGFMVLELPVYTKGGISAENLDYWAQLWMELLRDFRKSVGWK